MNLPLQGSAWVILEYSPRGQILGGFPRKIPRLNCNLSRNSDIFRLRPYFVSSRIFNQFDRFLKAG